MKFCFVRVKKRYLFYVVVRIVSKFHFGLVINEIANKWRTMVRRPCSDRDSCF
jgi:hypothetical protein